MVGRLTSGCSAGRAKGPRQDVRSIVIDRDYDDMGPYNTLGPTNF
jgi:hypothetical protein